MKPRTSRPRAGGKLPQTRQRTTRRTCVPNATSLSVHIETELPISIVTPKISTQKTNSIFYAGKDIAEARVPGLNRTPRIIGKASSATRWTDKDIEELDLGDISTWGWFGINIWQGETCLDYPVDAYSTYDEALEAFQVLVQQDVLSQLLTK